MFVLIEWGSALLRYKIVRGGQPKPGRILHVQQADDRSGKLKAIRQSKVYRVQVIRGGPGEVPQLHVTWLKEEECHQTTVPA